VTDPGRRTGYWEWYYAEKPLTVGRTNYLEQVGHTVLGRPIDAAQFETLVARIEDLLDLDADDVLLDLCCGNGLFTHRLAQSCKKVVGVDFSEPLLQIAEEAHSAPNIVYRRLNVLDLGTLRESRPERFTKVLMYAALQHFDARDLRRMLEDMIALGDLNPIILLGFVPDRARKWKFYDTPRRKLAHVLSRATGRDRFGSWWRREIISRACDDLGLECTFHDLPETLHAATYRFDVRIAAKGQTPSGGRRAIEAYGALESGR